MLEGKASAKLAGFGGQGVVLASVILGRAAILDGSYSTQTASYGSESRGGECRAEVVISNEPIDYPLVDKVQTLVAMSQPALSKYADDLLPEGLLIVDPDMVSRMPTRTDVHTTRIPAAKTADAFGGRIFENIVMLGALQVKTKVISEESLRAAIRESVPSKTLDANLKAASEGVNLASRS
jgi:2-oxoglutarate ferredoxin oxidoreductase subunit gamma